MESCRTGGGEGKEDKWRRELFQRFIKWSEINLQMVNIYFLLSRDWLRNFLGVIEMGGLIDG